MDPNSSNHRLYRRESCDGREAFIDRGFNGWLHKPFSSADLSQQLSAWRGFDPKDPDAAGNEVRLSAPLGVAQSQIIFERFYISLMDAIAAIDAGADPKPYGHSICGLAGMLGISVLGEAWLALEDGRTDAWPIIRTLTLEAIEAAEKPKVDGFL